MVPGRRYNVRYVLRALRKSWWMLMLPLFVIGSLAAVIAKALPNVYYAQSTIVILKQRIPESYVRSTVTVSLSERLQTTREHVLSRPQLEQLIMKFDLFPVLRKRVPMEALVVWLRRGIRVQLVKADTFVVGYAGYDPASVQKIAEHLATVFIRESFRERETLADNTSQFLEKELNEARERLLVHERAVEDYRRRYAGQLPSQLEANLRILQNTAVQLQAVVETLNRDRDRREQLARDLALATAQADAGSEPTAAESAPPPEGLPMSVTLPVGPPVAQLRAARANREKLLLRLTPEHPDIQALDRVIAGLEKAVAGQPVATDGKPARVPPGRVAELREVLRALDDQIAGRQVVEKKLRDTVAIYQGRVESVPEREAEWVRLTRDYNTLQGVYAGLLAKREESRIAANLERQQVGEQFRIVEQPVVPSRPASPNRPSIVLGGLAIGFAIGMALLVVRELRDRGFRAEEEIAVALKLPVIGLVPVILTNADRRRLRRRRLFWSAAALVLCAGLAAMRFVR